MRVPSSFNRALIHAAVELAPDGMTIEPIEIGELPVAVMGASPSQIGTARAQLHLRQLLGHVQARVLPPPELLFARAHERFDAGLRLKDEGTRKVLGDLLVRFSRWIARERAAAEAERELLKLARSVARGR